MVVNRWRWRWQELCGADGFQIWSQETHDIGICFEQLCLQIPVLFILAVVSAYYTGMQNDWVQRGRAQLMAIRLRSLAVCLMAVLPLLQIYIDMNKTTDRMEMIYYFLSAVQGIAWFTHLGYTLALEGKLGLSPRGPVFMLVIWSMLFVLSILSLRTHLLHYRLRKHGDFRSTLSFTFSIVKLILQIVYGCTLLPGQGPTTFITRNEPCETQPLLGNEYSRFLEERDPTYLGIAMEGNSWFSRLLFRWVNPLMVKGVQGQLKHCDDLYDLPDALDCASISAKIDKVLIGNVDAIGRSVGVSQADSQVSISSTSAIPEVIFDGFRRHNVSLIRALHKCFWLEFYGIGILKLASDCLRFTGPILLNKLVTFISDKSENIGIGYGYATGLFIAALLGAFCDTHFNLYMSIVGLKIRSALVTTIYRKTLSVSSTTLNAVFSTGEIINFMSTDTDRVVNSCPSFHAVWSIPLQLVVALYLLYEQVGLAFLAGITFSIVLIPINRAIAKTIGKYSALMMEKKDDRVRLMTEILHGIRYIKIAVWEQHFLKMIGRIRDQEVKYLRKRKYLDAACVYFWATTPVLISILTFSTYYLMGNQLTAAIVFTTMALVNMLIAPLNAFPWVLNGITEAWVSIKRIQKLFDLEDLDLDVYYDDSLIENSHCEVVLKKASFSWRKPLNSQQVASLHSVNRKSVKDRGIGKKSTKISNGSNNVEELRPFGLEAIDLEIRKGEFVGVMGTVASGKSSLLFAILAEIVKKDGSIAISDTSRGFGVVTQQPWLQRGTIRDNILFGKMYDDQRYRTVLDVCALNEDLTTLPAGDLTGVGEGGFTLSGGQRARVALARAVYQDKAIYLFDDIFSAVDVRVGKHIFQHCLMGLLKNKTRILCTHHLQYLLHADKVVLMDNGRIKEQGKPQEVLTNVDEFLPIDLELGESVRSDISVMSEAALAASPEDQDSLLNEEMSASGTVKFDVYSKYWKAIGHLLCVAILMSLLLMQTSRNLTDWWLSLWVNQQQNSSINISTLFGTPTFIRAESINFFDVYIALGLTNSFFTLFRAFLFAYGGIAAATSIHKSLLKSVMKSKVTFFDVSPVGRILNRFSSDTYIVDDSLPFILNIWLAQVFGVIGSVALTIYGLPWLCVVLVPLIPVYHWLQNYYRLTSRELKRLSSVSLSPVYSHFNETLQGLATIRAFRATGRFKRDNEENVEANVKAQFASQAAAQWLSLRLQFIGVAMIAGVGFIAVIQHQFDVADPGMVGLAISYALSMTGLLNGVVNAFTESEREMIAVERVGQYIDCIQPESSTIIMEPPYAWPFQGVISFRDVYLRYRENLSPALKGVTFETRPAEKIGVVGRTGAGKSSLLSALFRLVEVQSGSITIDSVNISHISLQALRSRLSCIPQEPFLFSGTIRDNLNPLGEFREHEIWNALERVNLAPAVRRLGGLDAVLSSRGSNLSLGQRQLFCLARAVLHNTKILCIDEATANVDHDTDRLIQDTLRSTFRNSTVITIAHRVQTVLDCDRVLVMGDGVVLEFDTPSNLLADPNSHFYYIVNHE